MTEPRPSLWLGHTSFRTTKLDETEAFLKQIGCRHIFRGDEVAVVEIRGGTHIVAALDPDHVPGDVDFDLMVEDLDGTHASFLAQGLDVTELERGKIHDWFYVTEPGGSRIKFNSTHVPDHDAV